QGSAFDLPYKDGFFDLVFTSGVLIHISPQEIDRAIAEIARCSRHAIWGFEYFAETYTAIPYRGRSNLLWKTDFAKLYTDQIPGLRVVRERKVPHRDSSGNVDKM